MRPKRGVQPKRKLVGGRLIIPQRQIPFAFKGPASVSSVPIRSTNITTQVQRDMGQGLSNMSAQDRINTAFKNLRLGQQNGRGVRML